MLCSLLVCVAGIRYALAVLFLGGQVFASGPRGHRRTASPVWRAAHCTVHRGQPPLRRHQPVSTLVEASGCCCRGSRLIYQQVSLSPPGGTPERSAPFQKCGLALLSRLTILASMVVPSFSSCRVSPPRGVDQCLVRRRKNILDFRIFPTRRLYSVASAGSAGAAPSAVASMTHSRMYIVCGTVEACMLAGGPLGKYTNTKLSQLDYQPDDQLRADTSNSRPDTGRYQADSSNNRLSALCGTREADNSTIRRLILPG